MGALGLNHDHDKVLVPKRKYDVSAKSEITRNDMSEKQMLQ